MNKGGKTGQIDGLEVVLDSLHRATELVCLGKEKGKGGLSRRRIAELVHRPVVARVRVVRQPWLSLRVGPKVLGHLGAHKVCARLSIGRRRPGKCRGGRAFRSSVLLTIIQYDQRVDYSQVRVVQHLQTQTDILSQGLQTAQIDASDIVEVGVLYAVILANATLSGAKNDCRRARGVGF